MRRFENKTSKELDFELGGEFYRVAPGGFVEIPDRFAYAVGLVKLPLEEHVPELKAPEAKPSKK